MTNTTLGVRMSRKVRGPVKIQSHLEQGWRIRCFEGAQAPPRRQKHPLEIKEKLHKPFVILRYNKNMVT